MITLRHLRAGGGDCVGRSVARWSSFMHVSVYLEAESPCQFPVFQTTHFGALVILLFHELLGLQLRRLLRWSSIGAREGYYLLCSLLLEPWIKDDQCSRKLRHTFERVFKRDTRTQIKSDPNSTVNPNCASTLATTASTPQHVTVVLWTIHVQLRMQAHAAPRSPTSAPKL
jgi:hypothetical protein